MKFKVGIPVLIACLLSMNCATLFKGDSSKIKISSDPADAEVFVDEDYVGKTPLETKLISKDDHNIEFRKEGFKTKTVYVESRIGAKWLILDIFGASFTIFLSIIVDAINDNWKELSKTSISAVLQPISGAPDATPPAPPTSASTPMSAAGQPSLPKAEKLFQNEKYEEAIGELNRFIVNNETQSDSKGDIANAYYLLGKIYFQIRDDAKAEKSLGLLLTADPDFSKDETNALFKSFFDKTREHVREKLQAAAAAERDWSTARENDEIQAYATFLNQHPGSSHEQEAKARRELLMKHAEGWERARRNPSRQSLKDYCKRNPGSPYLPKARALIQELGGGGYR